MVRKDALLDALDIPSDVSLSLSLCLAALLLNIHSDFSPLPLPLFKSLETSQDGQGEKTSPPQPELTEGQRVLSDFIAKAARCFSEVQVKNLRVDYSKNPDDSKCGVCGTGFWGGSVGMTLPKQRHHCYCCGKAMCNRCTVTVQMENGHQVDGLYRKDFTWQGRFCIDHDLITGETRAEVAAANESEWSVLPHGPLAWLGFVCRAGSLLVSVFPVVSTLSTVYSVGRPLLWTYKVVRLFV